MSIILTNLKQLILITFLYTLQGIPHGFCNLMTLLLLSTKSSYKDIAYFSTTYYPYSFKILWSPLVDSIFSHRVGRRRSWILPTQFTMAAIFIILGFPIKSNFNLKDDRNFIADGDQKEFYFLLDRLVNDNSIVILTIIFFVLFTATATQDIALDAWALSLLPSPIKHLASTCQTAGLNFGTAMGFNIVLALTSPKFKRFSSVLPLRLGWFCLGFGVMALITNFYILFCVPEKDGGQDEVKYSLGEAYRSIGRMVELINVRIFTMVILSAVAPFGPNMFLINSYSVKLGLVEKEFLAVLDLVSVPLSILLPNLLISKKNNDFLGNWLHFVYVKFGISVCLSIQLYLASGGLSNVFRTGFCVLYVVFWLFDKMLFIQYFAFCSKICDETYGGTYLTFLAVIYNLGHIWVRVLSFSSVDYFNKTLKSSSVDGYTILSIISFIYGIIWLWKITPIVKRLSKTHPDQWKLSKTKTNQK